VGSALGAPLGAGRAGSRVGGLSGGEESCRVDLLQVATGGTQATPAAGNRRQRTSRHLAEHLLLDGVEHEVHICSVARERREDPTRRPERHPIEMRRLADVGQAKEHLARACCGESHVARLHPRVRPERA